jgi:hypothetical protein
MTYRNLNVLGLVKHIFNNIYKALAPKVAHGFGNSSDFVLLLQF